MSSSNIGRSIQEYLAGKLGVAPEAVLLTERFRRLGVDSMMATSMLAAVGAQLGRTLSPTLAWQYPTPGELAKYLAGELEEPATPAGADAMRASDGEPIAIVGLACRFPGAPDADAYWRLLRDGVDAVREPPKDRWDLDEYYDADPATPGKVCTRWGGFLDDIATFDASFFGISPREAQLMDPQQRLMMELSWEAFEDAGIAPTVLKDTRTGVFYGAMWMDYGTLPGATADRIAQHTATGLDLSIVPARVSYTLGLLGPSLAVNTACSSSLVAIHLARQSLLRGESRVALAGAVNLLVSVRSTIMMSRFGAMAPDGRSKAFDARANGYVRGEGGGVVVLKRLSDAIADGDHVYCVIRGAAVNNDGFSNGLTAPSPKAQEGVLRDACADAALAPTEVQYVEAHGTGTKLGDPIEAGALGAVLGKGRPANDPLRVGSVKTNIGHLEAAAGMAGLIKVVLSMENGELPPSLHYQTPNPHIPFEELRVRVQAAREPWEARDGKRIAGISSFGFGGTNAHVILEKSVPPVSRPAAPGASVNAVAGKKLVGLFAGQGSQWAGMGRSLLRDDPAARAVLLRCDRAMKPIVGWSLVERLMRADAAQYEETPFIQPAIFAIQIALCRSLEARGLKLDAVIGQSMGEVGAAYAAGALALEDAARVICVRSELTRKLSGGRMAVVPAGPEETAEAIAPYGEALSIAVLGGPESTVVAGEEPAMVALTTALAARGLQVRAIRVDYASHSRFVDPLLEELRAALAGVHPRDGRAEFWSTVEGGPVPGASLDADYWVRNLRQPVRLGPTIQRYAREHDTVFVELDPHPVLETIVEKCLAQLGGTAAPFVATGERDEAEVGTLAAAAESLVAHGVSSRPAAAATPRSAELVVLSAKTPEALQANARRLRDHVLAHPEDSLSDLAFTLASARAPMESAAVLAVPTRDALVAALEETAEGKVLATRPESSGSAPRVAFVFPGQGSQWVGMARELLDEEPAFRDALVECDRVIAAQTGWSVLEELRATPTTSRLHLIDVVQPVLFAVQVGLVALWRSWGVEPHAVVGHSMGEGAAAYAAGALSLEDAARAIVVRGALLKRLSGTGAMALVDLSAEDAQRELAGLEDRIGVGVTNSRRIERHLRRAGRGRPGAREARGARRLLPPHQRRRREPRADDGAPPRGLPGGPRLARAAGLEDPDALDGHRGGAGRHRDRPGVLGGEPAPARAVRRGRRGALEGRPLGLHRDEPAPRARLGGRGGAAGRRRAGRRHRVDPARAARASRDARGPRRRAPPRRAARSGAPLPRDGAAPRPAQVRVAARAALAARPRAREGGVPRPGRRPPAARRPAAPLDARGHVGLGDDDRHGAHAVARRPPRAGRRGVPGRGVRRDDARGGRAGAARRCDRDRGD